MIILYTGPGCPSCQPAKKFLEQHGVPFEEIDVGEDPDALDYLNMRNISSIPVLEFTEDNGQHPIIGFSYDIYSKELRKRGVPI